MILSDFVKNTKYIFLYNFSQKKIEAAFVLLQNIIVVGKLYKISRFRREPFFNHLLNFPSFVLPSSIPARVMTLHRIVNEVWRKKASQKFGKIRKIGS